MKFDYWAGKRILITGGTSGLGYALASKLVAGGAKVAVVARHARSIPDGIHFIRADVSRKEDIHRIAAEALAVLGGLDVLVNNASALGPTPLRLLLDTECEDFEAVLQTNLMGPFRLTKILLPTFLLQHHGTIVNISSDAAVSAYPNWGIYSSSKAALDHLTRVWAAELQGLGVRFLAIDPGDMDTPMHAAALPESDPSSLLSPQDSAERLMRLLEDFESRVVRASL